MYSCTVPAIKRRNWTSWRQSDFNVSTYSTERVILIGLFLRHVAHKNFKNFINSFCILTLILIEISSIVLYLIPENKTMSEIMLMWIRFNIQIVRLVIMLIRCMLGFELLTFTAQVQRSNTIAKTSYHAWYSLQGLADKTYELYTCYILLNMRVGR